MNLSDYIKKVCDETKAKEISFDVKLNSLGLVDENGACRVRFKLTRK